MLKVMAVFFKLLVAEGPKLPIVRYVTKLSPQHWVVLSFFLSLFFDEHMCRS